jgi:tetratricopeptide (TPR) repeat protein
VTEACPSDDTLARLVEAKLDDASAAQVQEHIDACARCQALYAAVARAVADAAQFGGGEIVGKYQIEDRLGAGGMGVVYRALDRTLRRKVALKLLSPGLADDPQARARLEREARACAALDHPHVGGVHEIGEHRGRIFLVMPLFEGGTLKERLLQGPLPLEQAVTIFRELTGALAAAHKAGVVHRDVKPGNIMLTPGGVRLVDFGLAKVSSLSATLSTAGQLLGTPAYMAPEQFEGESDVRSDVWSAGAVAYEMLGGQAPFRGDTLQSLAAAVRLKEPAPLQVPRELGAIVFTCLDKEPARRYPSAVELEADLERLAQNRPTVARPAGALDKLGRIARRWRWPLGVGAAGLVAVAAVALVMRASAAERVRRAQSLTQKAVELRSIMREAHLLPLHDTRPERAQVRAGMAAVEAQLAELGPAADATGHYALGSGWAALGDWPKALAELEKAWAAGERDPEMAFLLGYAGSRLYHAQMAEARNLPQKARAAREAELQTRLRDPALARLREAATTESRELVEALIAYDEMQFDKARTAAEHAFSAAPRRYEAGGIAGEAQAALGTLLWKKGDREQAIQWLERASATYKRVTEIARSDDAAYADAARERYYSLALYAERGDVGEGMMRSFVELWQKARQANPDDIDLAIGEARAEDVWGGMLAGRAADWEPHVRAAIAIAEKVVADHPDSAGAWMILGTARANLADYAVHDRRDNAQMAVAALEKALLLKPDPEYRIYLASAWNAVAQEEMGSGLDATASWEHVRRELESLLKDDPNNQMIHYNLGDGLGTEAAARERMGADPLPIYQEAAQHLRRSAELDRSDAMPSKRLAEVQAEVALRRARKGEDAAAELKEARANLEATIRADASIVDLWRTRTMVELADAASLAAAGSDPQPALRRARTDAAKLIELWGKSNGDTDYLLRAEVELWAARLAKKHSEPSLKQALADAVEAGRLSPDHTEAQLVIARVELLRGHADAGLKALEHAGKLPSVEALRVKLLELRGDAEAAAKLRATLPKEAFSSPDLL